MSPTEWPAFPMSRPTYSTSFFPPHSSQYEHTQHIISSSSVPRAPTPISRSRRRPTHLLRLPKQAPNLARNDRDKLLKPQLHRPQQQYRRHISELLGHLGNERLDVHLELHDQDMRTWGDVGDVFPAARVRERRIRVRLFDVGEFEMFGATTWGPGHGCAGVLWSFQYLW